MQAFDLFLFSTDPDYIRLAVAAGVSGIIVDWEHLGKATRQAGCDTEINHNTLEDLCRVRSATHARVLCRVNSYGAHTPKEIEDAVAAGTDEILLPMVGSVDEVKAVIEMAAGRCGVGILIETVEAVEILNEFASLPLSRVYVGLNDLAISRRLKNLFVSVEDGTVEYIRKQIHVPFGFAGLTLPEAGYPVPCRLLIGEMVRLDCRFSFLRRSFYRDTGSKDLSLEVPRIHEAIEQCRLRSPQQVLEDHSLLQQFIREWDSKNG